MDNSVSRFPLRHNFHPGPHAVHYSFLQGSYIDYYLFWLSLRGGLAYMFLEISLLQQFIHYLYDPIFSASVVIGSFLVYSGIGSLIAKPS